MFARTHAKRTADPLFSSAMWNKHVEEEKNMNKQKNKRVFSAAAPLHVVQPVPSNPKAQHTKRCYIRTPNMPIRVRLKCYGMNFRRGLIAHKKVKKIYLIFSLCVGCVFVFWHRFVVVAAIKQRFK